MDDLVGIEKIAEFLFRFLDRVKYWRLEVFLEGLGVVFGNTEIRDLKAVGNTDEKQPGHWRGGRAIGGAKPWCEEVMASFVQDDRLGP
jgi:hypothetical protein